MQRPVDRFAFAVIGALALALVAVLAGLADAGPLDPLDPLGSTDSVKLPGTPISGQTTIVTPGHYYVTRDIAVSGAVTAITIDTDNVTLDLGGFTLSGTDTILSYGVRIVGHHRITISNGVVRDFTEGISMSNATDVRISNIVARSSNTGFVLGADSLLENCGASQNSVGVIINGSRSVLTDCQIDSSTYSGATVDAAHDVLIERSSIKGNNSAGAVPGGGIFVKDSQRATIRYNDLGSNTTTDVYLQSGADHVVIDNTLGCPGTSVLQQGPPSPPTNVFAPVNTTDPHTNRAHRAGC